MKAMIFEQKFKVHPVGQGLFYSGSINLNNANFNFVFDCGSISIKNSDDSVNEFLTSLSPSAPLDLLVISHFDEDHINNIAKLLAGERKVKNLVLPFMNFRERLFLALRVASHGVPADPTLATIIDPIGTLGPNLDGGSNIFFIKSGPKQPSPSEGEILEPTTDGLAFDIPGKEEINQISSEFKASSNTKAKKFTSNDSQQGFLVSIRYLMEFVFYRKQLSSDDDVFYKKVEQLFFKDNKINPSWSDEEILRNTIEAIKKKKPASKIKSYFNKAFEANSRIMKLSKSSVTNMNTTSLSMLHGNRNEDIAKVLGAGSITELIYQPVLNINGIHGYPYQFVYPLYNNPEKLFPNTLLTSDGFILSEADANIFFKHFEKYWSKFWLFQIPHHGSNYNSDRHLLTKLNGNKVVFINYGIDHKRIKVFRHPAPELMMEMAITGILPRFSPVHENQYISFSLLIRRQVFK